ncbi:MAG TPA: hypothetical protein VK867_10860 [Candidatus Limnocylindrales bacterium]|nr:hypothetical protein [Candidatus Limnocylindrales bacterium]
MTKERDIERLLDRWFSERQTEVADRVLDDVADRIGRQPQQPAWRVSWRDPHMQTNLKTLLAAAAVIVIAVVGFAVIRPGSTSNVGGAATPSPSATAPAAPSTSPAASAVFPQWYKNSEISAAAGILPAGKVTSRAFAPRATFTVPEGWVNDLDVNIGYGLFPDIDANEVEYAKSGEIAQGIFMVSVESPYFFCEAWEKTPGTAAERAAFLVASDAFVVSEPVDVTIGGLTGKQVDVRLDPDRPTATCPGDPAAVDLGDQRTRVTYLDTPSGIIAISAGSKYSADHEAFLADAMPIVESFQFDLSQ